MLEITHHRTFTSAALGEAEVDLDLETEGAAIAKDNGPVGASRLSSQRVE